MKYQLPELHFNLSDIGELFTDSQLNCHYNGHHKAYIDKVNKEIRNTALEKQSLIDLMRSQRRLNKKLANNAAQAWNHTFFWNCLNKKSEDISPLFGSLLSNRGCSVESIKKKFIDRGVELFGSGYVWIVLNRDFAIKVLTSKNAQNPLQYDHDCLPILTADVWEHAYYLDYQMNREKYLNQFWDHINWSWVNELLSDRSNLSKIEDSMLLAEKQDEQALNKNSFTPTVSHHY
ncbi:MAG: superoxide dismutase [Bdellovibrionota bacterium]